VRLKTDWEPALSNTLCKQIKPLSEVKPENGQVVRGVSPIGKEKAYGGKDLFHLFRLCRKDEILFDNVAETGNIVAKYGNIVEAKFDFVKRIVWLAAFDSVASALLLVWKGL